MRISHPKTTRILVERLPSCAQTSPSEGARRARRRQANQHGCKFLGLNREDFCAGCKGKRGCKRPRAEAATPVPPAGPPTAPSLLPREKKAVGRYSDDPRYDTKVRDHRIDPSEAVGRVQHRKRMRLFEWV